MEIPQIAILLAWYTMKGLTSIADIRPKTCQQIPREMKKSVVGLWRLERQTSAVSRVLRAVLTELAAENK